MNVTRASNRFSNLVVIPARDGAEIDLEGPAYRRDVYPVGSLYGAREMSDGARPIARSEEQLVGPVLEVLAGERTKKFWASTR